MPALTKPRSTPEREGIFAQAPVKAATTIYQGALVVMDAGLAVPGKTATDLVALGVAETTIANVGGNGALSVPFKRGVFGFFNKADDAVTAAEIGSACFIVDDQTVAKTSATGTRSQAGIVVDVDGEAVWVRVGL